MESSHFPVVTMPVATGDHSSNGRKMPSARCYYEYEAFTSLQILKSEASSFLKKNQHSKKLKRLTVKDKSMPTPINLNTVDKLLSSMIDSYCLGSVRIFNTVSLQFRERGGTNLLLSIATLCR
jgi:hypothetical protein